MIHRLVVDDPNQAICPWWKNVEWLKGKTEVAFKPGMNILFGKNGSGKSTVLTTIAKLLCCYDGDHQLVGNHTNFDFKGGVRVEHDGSPIMHFDPSQSVGLLGGSFDYDFMEMGLSNCMSKGSAGQTTLRRMDRILGTALGKVPWPEVSWKAKSPEQLPSVAARLAGDGTKVCPTILLDEPSANLELDLEIRLFEVLAEIAKSGVQVIIATHSPFALHFEDVNIIDVTPGYYNRVRVASELHFLKAIMQDPKGFEIMCQIVALEKAVPEPPEPAPEPVKKPARKRTPKPKG